MEESFTECVDLLIALMAASNGCDAVERSFTLDEVNEIWRIVGCETLLWVKPSLMGELLVHMKVYERVDRGMDIMEQMQMAKAYVDELMAFLDSNESYRSDVYKKLTVEYDDDEAMGTSDEDWGADGGFPFEVGNIGEGDELYALFNK